MPLQIADFPASVVTIIQGTIVLAVVVANEIARRVARRAGRARRGRRSSRRCRRRRQHRRRGRPRRRAATGRRTAGSARHEHGHSDDAGRARPEPQRRASPPCSPAAAGRRRACWSLLAGALVLLAAVRVISGEQALTSSSTMAAALLLAVPIGLAALGGLFSERAGVVNIGLEGMMILGTWGAGWAGYQWGWGAALVGGVLFGALGGLLHAVATVTFGVDHVVSGVAINILAAGIVRFLSELLYTDNTAGGGVTQSPALSSEPPSLSPAGAVLRAGPAGRPGEQALVPVSDVAGVLRGRHPRRRGADHPRRPAGPADATCCSGGRRSGCGCAPAGRTPPRPTPSACRSTG